MNKFFLTLFACLATLFTNAGNRDFSVNLIPKELSENSNSVIRYKDVSFEINSARKAVYKVSYAITILNDNALQNAALILFYSDFSKIRKTKGTVFDQNGKKTDEIDRDRFVDLSAISGYETYSESRAIYAIPKCRTTPFTVEYSYEMDFNGILDYPDFYLVTDYNMAVEQASMVVFVPDSLGIRYFERNNLSEPLITNEKAIGTYTWKFNNIKALRNEPYSPAIDVLSPVVMLAPLSFKIGGKWGSGDSWESFGIWYNQLLKDRDNLSEESCRKIKTLTEGVPDTLEKIKLLYAYMQNRMRYTSIQVGIGGWQPAPADEVDRLCYGDCKALTNYMKAILKAAGINSLYTLVKAGEHESDLIPDFPASQFNHVMLCVPLKKDTIWLECTSQIVPVDYPGTFTDDRYVLLIKETGGYITRTRRFDEKTNILGTSGDIKIGPEGNAEIQIVRSNQGLFYENSFLLIHMDETDRKKEISQSITAPNFTLRGFDLKEIKTGKPCIEEVIRLSVNKYCVIAGNQMLLRPNQVTKENDMAAQFFKRDNPIEIRRSTLKTDTLAIELPEGYSFTGNHLSQDIKSRFGEYTASTVSDGNRIVYVRSLLVNKGNYPADSYSEFLDFFEKISTADKKKIALKRNME